MYRLLSRQPPVIRLSQATLLEISKNSIPGLQVSVQFCRCKSSSNDYIHESIVPSDHFQKSLPRLPIPKLEQTCERYLASQAVLQTEQEHASTKQLVDEFLKGEGKELHEQLVQRDQQNKHTSYISEPWFDMYLKDRRPLSLTHNPFITFTDDPRPEYMDQLVRATNLVVSSLRFMKTYRANLLEPDVYHLNPKKSDTLQFRKFVRMLPQAISFYGAYWYKAFPLDMSQYPNLYNSTRIPKHDKDVLFTDSSAKHMLVIRKGHMYLFDAIDRDGNIVSPETIMSHIKYILNDPRPPNEYALGVLTTMERDKWSTVRTQLCNAGDMNESAFFSSGVMNEGYMKLVDSALFVLALDDTTPEDPNEITRNFLHGDGTNRWFDKSFSLILTKDGRAAVNFEHAWGDGVAVLRYFNEVWKESTTKPFVHPSTVPSNVDSALTVQNIEFALDPKLKEYIDEARTTYATKCSSLDVDHLEYDKFTKECLKKQKLSPDAILQLVIQMAYYKQYNKTVATYESCSTAAFRHGRTETIRSATHATKKACEMFNQQNNTYSVGDLREALEQSSKYHGQLTKEAAMGQGWDRHLFAMKYYAAQEGTVPMLYQDPGYTNINHIILSTSTLSSPSVVIGGFGAVTHNGYGVGYAVENERIGFNVTNYPPETNVHEFIECLKESLDDINAVFEGRNPRST
ncbi:carnitine O-palmitoyltransferase 2, mitochondrial-like isoform X2 [Mercenaria mercenaria]|uniref:carnitine O-palmitoyltransferase 2, mitochondrial-like isoform X2 n=1 Tax=Mercenaria mercenaria TaxID=6596 RepID=UPI00234F9535|nr:carnitine O-palmitoyltransferase 2, mitochondrial-like isoform X2 [Mercenaria mercenaria]